MRSRLPIALLLPCTLSWLSACGSDGSPDGADEASISDGASELSLLTFNGALGVGLAENPDERLVALTRDVPRVEAGIVCLNEVWRLQDVVHIVDELKEQYPYSHYTVRSSKDAAAAGCTANESTSLLGCLTQACSTLTEDALISCAVEHCASAFAGVKADCQDCIISHQDQSPDTIVESCSPDSVGGPSEGDSTLANQNGLVLLSRYPLQDTNYLALDSSFGDRGVLSARVKVGPTGNLRVFCTHLAATQAGIDYAGDDGSWAGEREAQTLELLNWIDLSTEEDTPNVVLGDLNSGPATAHADAEEPAAFERFIEAGFDSPYTGSSAGECTWCTSNPLTRRDDTSSPGSIIDHILLSGFPPGLRTSSARVLDEVVEIEVDGQLVSTHYSDHFGVRVVLTAEP